jgi:hypothetical protein
MNPNPPLNRLLAWYTTLTPHTLDLVDRYYSPHAYFKDPFNEVRGHEGIKAIFQHMFNTSESPHFVINNQFSQAENAFVTWVFHFKIKGKTYAIVGSSHLRFGLDGRVDYHRDYWDTSEELFMKLPLIGGFIRTLRKQFVVPQ